MSMCSLEGEYRELAVESVTTDAAARDPNTVLSGRALR